MSRASAVPATTGTSGSEKRTPDGVRRAARELPGGKRRRDKDEASEIARPFLSFDIFLAAAKLRT